MPSRSDPYGKGVPSEVFLFFLPQALLYEWQGGKNFVAFRIPPGIIRLFIEKEKKELKKFLKDIDEIKIIFTNKNYPSAQKKLINVNRTNEGLERDNFKDLLVIKDGDEVVNIKINEEKGLVNEVIILISNTEEFVVLSLVGKMELENINKLAEESKIIEYKRKYHFDTFSIN